MYVYCIYTAMSSMHNMLNLQAKKTFLFGVRVRRLALTKYEGNHNKNLKQNMPGCRNSSKM
jgi:hypothetical protein